MSFFSLYFRQRKNLPACQGFTRFRLQWKCFCKYLKSCADAFSDTGKRLESDGVAVAGKYAFLFIIWVNYLVSFCWCITFCLKLIQVTGSHGTFFFLYYFKIRKNYGVIMGLCHSCTQSLNFNGSHSSKWIQ